MSPRLTTMIALSVAAHAAVLAPVFFAAPNPLPLAATPISVALAPATAQSKQAGATAEAAPRPVVASPHTRAATAEPRVAPAAIESAAADPAGERATPPSRDTVNHLRASLVTQLERYFVYPTLARRRGWQGEVAVALRIDPDGRVRALRVARSSGYAVLDRDALATLNRIGVLPRAASWLNGQAYHAEIPVIYRLTEG